jgi:threonylcarbamoyladenosine tRNA methylthiotransferase MtaB
VPQKERERRSKELHEISARKTAAFYAGHEGYEAIVLWEGGKDERRETRDERPLMYGWTENYIRVSCPYDEAKVNTFERITVRQTVPADIPDDTQD